MKKTAAVLFLVGAILLVLHALKKDEAFIMDQSPQIISIDRSYGWYIRGGIAGLGIIFWLCAKTSE